jgi:hypothetical protein
MAAGCPEGNLQGCVPTDGLRGGTLVARRGTVVHEPMRSRTLHAGDPSRVPRDAAPRDVFSDRALIVPRDGERGDSRDNGTASLA